MHFKSLTPEDGAHPISGGFSQRLAPNHGRFGYALLMLNTAFHQTGVAIALMIGVAPFTSGCTSNPKQGGPDQINHVVLFQLENPDDAAELQRDCLEYLEPIPEVSYYACGPHVDVGRTNIEDGYSLGLIVSFEDQAAYDAYLVAPGHVHLVEKWKPRFSELTIYDIGNTVPSKTEH